MAMNKTRLSTAEPATLNGGDEIAGSLLLGVDGGGSKTVARVAAIREDGGIETLGDGRGGPSNVCAVGAAHALINLDVAVDAAFEAAGVGQKSVGYAVLALAGSSLPDVQSTISSWARQRDLATHVDVVHDVDPVLAIGVPEQNGVALIVGTGSVAIAVNRSGERAVVGGWGHWFGDQGSGYDLGRRALAAVAAAVDGLGPDTTLAEQILERFQTENAREILRILGAAVDIPHEIATLAPLVLAAAESEDAVAWSLVNEAASSTAALVAASAFKLGLKGKVPIALAGSIVCSNELFRKTLIAHLRASNVTPDPVMTVTDPVAGSLIMAGNRLLASRAI